MAHLASIIRLTSGSRPPARPTTAAPGRWGRRTDLTAGGDVVRAPSPRRMMYLCLTGWGAVIAVSGVLLVTKVISTAVAAMVITDAALLAALGTLLAVTVRIHHRVARLTRAIEQDVQKDRAR